ncbi:transcriptional regulator with XRE-family HTH domain [Variovorax boronicumulans]|uniref:helix-turn-helix domain-containing protein n=1 Tax=Variovorax TaxID=34072 RepID=UPI00278A54BF|nr:MULTISPECIES: helix-turn-helix transcriptional regulator [Variovorax]MDQ0073602.1 transcriptional regulator with XRE-family HTH domain [Variovorax boronicumulans]MDQ0606906.1 transcriptional regulator with XRE-family HTH domain [Variovorax sp. W1I1]
MQTSPIVPAAPSTPSTPSLGPALKRWRLLHRVKQSHAAELFNVNQSTISRWESGTQAMEPAERARAEALLSARLDAAADHALARLVNESPRPVHLVCDITHRLLASSARRAAEFGAPLSLLLGRSLWRYATPEIAGKEAMLDGIGWRDALAPPSLEFATGTNSSQLVPIAQSRCRWTRLTLSDGTSARLVETL